MAFFRQLEVPRTNVASQNPILYDHGRGAQGFYTPAQNSKYLYYEIIPHDNKWSDGTPSFMAPLSHYHLLQTEHFHVKSGSGYWYVSGKKKRLNAGDDIIIPKFTPHRFESIPNDSEMPLVIEYRYDARRWEMEERFFRNTLTYLDDCRKLGVEPSLPQLCLFLADCWMPADIIPYPGGDYVKCAVNALFMWVLAAIGMLVYGYKASYIEYYDPSKSLERVETDGKKEK